MPVEDVAERWHVSPRTVRRTLQRWREAGRPGAPRAASVTSLRDIERSIDTVVRRMRDQLEKAEKTDDPLERTMFLARQGALYTTYVRLMEEAGFPRQMSAARLEPPESEWVHQINVSLRRVLERHSVSSETIEAAVDEVMIAWDRRRPGMSRARPIV